MPTTVYPNNEVLCRERNYCECSRSCFVGWCSAVLSNAGRRSSDQQGGARLFAPLQNLTFFSVKLLTYFISLTFHHRAFKVMERL